MALEQRLHERCACAAASRGVPSPFAFPGTRPTYERSQPFRIEHLALDWKLDVPAASVDAEAHVHAKRLDMGATELSLDAVGFAIHGVLLRDDEARGSDRKYKRADFTYDGRQIAVQVPKGARQVTLHVRYRVTPQKGLYFLAPDKQVTARPNQVWTQFQDEDARYVFPCHDKPHAKHTTELRVTVPKGWFALSNGERVSTESEHRTGFFHYMMNEPHSSYLVTLVAGQFEGWKEEGGVQLNFYVPPGREKDGHRTFQRTRDMMNAFVEKLGLPYPYPQYSQIVVSDFLFGGMENTTATTMYEDILLDERAALDITSDDLIAHELAHHWFGDWVTCRDWSHAWLNEGFATYMELVDREHLGRDEHDALLEAMLASYLDEADHRYQRPLVCHDYEQPIDLFDRHLYEKGACVIHMLRRELGEEAFWGGIRAYLTQCANAVADTEQLRRALEKASARNLEGFFQAWVYGAGHPDIEAKVERQGSDVHVHITQKPAAGKEATEKLFPLTLSFEIGTGKAKSRVTANITEPRQTVTLRGERRPDYVAVDPDFTFMGALKIKAPGDMLLKQAADATTARGRKLAWIALADAIDLPTVELAEKSLANAKEFWLVRAEAAGLLGKSQWARAEVALRSALGDAHPKVRRAVALALGEFRTETSAEALSEASRKDKSYLVQAEAARSLGKTKQTKIALPALKALMKIPSWADVVRAGALGGLASLRDDGGVPIIVEHTRYGVPTRGRRAAVRALAKIAPTKATREALEDLLASDKSPHFRTDVVDALVALGDPKARGALAQQMDREPDGRVQRALREALRSLGAPEGEETKRLRVEVDSLKSEQAELKARLDVLANHGKKTSHKGRKPKSR